MVNLLEDDPSVRAAARAAAKSLGLPGKLSTHEERLRKLYRKLKRSGELPKVQTSSDKREEIKKLYAARDAKREEMRRELAEAETEAEALGIKLQGENLVVLKTFLSDVHYNISLLKNLPAEHAYSTFMNRGVETADEALAAYDKAIEELPLLEKKIEVLDKVSRLRFMLGIS